MTTVLLTAFRARVLAGRSAAEAFSVQATAEDSTVVCMSASSGHPMEFITIRLTLGPEGRLEVIEQ